MREARVQWRAVCWFVVVTFTCTWTVEFIALRSGVRFEVQTVRKVGFLTGCMCIPALAAYVTRRWLTREGFATVPLQSLGSLTPFRHILVGVPLLFTLIYGFTALLGLGGFTGDPRVALMHIVRVPPGSALPSQRILITALAFGTFLTAPFVNALAAFGEEFGWTGYLLPHLLPLGKWKAAGTYGIIWGLWHGPLILGGFHYAGHPWAGVGLMCVFTLGVGMMQCALLLAYRSILLTSLLHGCVNANLLGLIPLLFLNVQPLWGGAFGVVGLVTLFVAGALVLWNTRQPTAQGAS